MRHLILLAAVVLLLPAVAAHAGEEQFNDTRELIASGTPCSELTEDQLTAIGDYYMEQMHPGEMHDLMDQHMGGEGSTSLRAAHIDMANRFYCSRFSASTTDRRGWIPMSGYGMGGMHWFVTLFWFGLLVLVGLTTYYMILRVRDERGEDADA